MALLTIVDAVRLTGVSRAQLYRYIKAGRLSRTPDGFLDTAELLRAGLMLQRRDETVPVSMIHDETQAPVSRETTPVSPVSSMHIEALERLIAVLKTELDTARERETTLLREAHERETLLLQMLSQVQQQNQRLLDMPRSPYPETPQDAPGATQPPRRPHSAPARPSTPGDPRSDMRRQIVALLLDAPDGLTAPQIQQLLGSDKRLNSTLTAMHRDRLLVRLKHGTYALPPPPA